MNVSLRRGACLAFACALLAVTVWFVVDFPILRWTLALGFIVYAVCLWRWPWLWLVAIPALLPVLDLASWSGRFFFDEFDAVVLLTAAVLALRETATPVAAAPLPRELKWLLALLAASYLISTAIRLWPPVPITIDSFANYASPYNSLRVAKGFVWALLLLQPLRQAVARYPNAKLLLGYGFLIGLTGVALAASYERWLFADIEPYRTTATFSSMHTGDGPIDVWFATTMPFVGLLLFNRRWTLLLPLTIALGLLSAYALYTTGSRGPVIAVLVALAIGALALLSTRAHRRRVVGVLALAIAAGFVATLELPVMLQSSLGQRFLQTPEDAFVRLRHWRDALALRDPTLATQLFGMGLGSFPAIHQQRSVHEPRTTRYRWVSSAEASFVRIWSGQNLYMYQSVAATQSDYRFSVQLRTSEPHAAFTVLWCEEWMLTSANCTNNHLDIRPLPGQWQSWTTTIRTGDVGSGRHLPGGFVERPTRLLFLVSGAPNTGVDVADVSLKDSQGSELLRNGDFAHGADRWFWEVDDHLQWHTKNLAVNILFDQGWFGILAVGGLFWLVLRRLVRRIGEHDWLSAIYLASLAGFAVTGTTVSTFDQPRLAFAFYMLCFAILSEAATTQQMDNA